ncbi:uncharacterized protein PG986_009289 [Apiospora aurea]|uniref:Uncharacterized protein n=1 Tax=Apiospora aurea TaxID=335848 RepID=A0ABR1Q7H9_9PEZI
MAVQDDYNYLQKEASAEASEFEAHTKDPDSKEEECSVYRTDTVHISRSYFNFYSGDDHYNSHHREPLLTRSGSPPAPDHDDRQPIPTRASRIFSKACSSGPGKNRSLPTWGT